MKKSVKVRIDEDHGVVRTTVVGVDKTPAECPICHVAVTPLDLGLALQIQGENALEQVFQCPNEECQHIFVARYQEGKQGFEFDSCVPIEPIVGQQSPTISQISPDFCLIYEQADKAEQHGLLLVAGPGYRKALEFLVKDYIISESTETGKELAIKKTTVEKTQLGACIANYIKSERIKEIARRATWLGNDETHYVRRWEDKDLKDLKKLISLTLHWIEIEKLTAEVMVDMPHRKP